MMLRFTLALLLIAVTLALFAVNANHRARKFYIALEAEQKRMRDLDVEWGQLRLEQSTWAAHSRIEKVARERLRMVVPQAGGLIVIGADVSGKDSR
jgi:cell division protein FtsL